MKVSVLQEKFVTALKLANEIAKTKKRHLAVLENVLLNANAEYKGQFLVSSTDLETALVVALGAMVTESGAISIPSVQLCDGIATMPDTRLELSTNDKTQMLTVSAIDEKGNKKGNNFKGLDASEFPIIPQMPTERVELDAGALLNALESCLKATINKAKWDTPKYATVINFTPTPNGLTLAATDGKKFARASVSIIGKSVETHEETSDVAGMAGAFNIAANSAKILLKVLSTFKPTKTKRGAIDNRELYFAKTDKYAFFQVRANAMTFIVVATIQDVKFPELGTIGTGEPLATFSISNAQQFAKDVKMLGTFGAKIRFSVNGELKVSAETWKEPEGLKHGEFPPCGDRTYPRYWNEIAYYKMPVCDAGITHGAEDGYAHSGANVNFNVTHENIAPALEKMRGMLTIDILPDVIKLTDATGKNTVVAR